MPTAFYGDTVARETIFKHKREFIYTDDKQIGEVSQVMNPGDYRIRFSFVLPNKIPSSIDIKTRKNKSSKYGEQNPKAKIKYSATVSLQNNDPEKLI